jgi:hypothetical protein
MKTDELTALRARKAALTAEVTYKLVMDELPTDDPMVQRILGTIDGIDYAISILTLKGEG